MEEKSKEITNKTIGSKVKYWRKQKKLTQEALSKKSDLPYTTLAKIESQVINNPSIQTVMKITKGLEITLDDLLGDL